jgi:demethylmacrocin O-methyltransferase
MIALAPTIWRSGNLDALARYYGTDKSSYVHGYTTLYTRHFARNRSKVRSLLEIGVGGTTSVEGYETIAGGQSLYMWQRYFPQAKIVGVDIYPKAVARGRVHFEQGDQADAAFLASLVAKHGPFDVIIDDGSHIGRDVWASFTGLWDAVRPGGYYVIEDLPAAYDPHWEGGPPGTPGTAVELIKLQVDDTLRRRLRPATDGFRPRVAAIHLYEEIVFFKRAGAVEPPASGIGKP